MQFTVKKILPVGSYRGSLKMVEQTTHPEYGAGCCFRFVVESGPEIGQEVSVTCNAERPPTKKNKLGRIIGGLLGRSLQPGEHIDCAQFVAKKYLFTVAENDDGSAAVVSAVVPDSM